MEVIYAFYRDAYTRETQSIHETQTGACDGLHVHPIPEICPDGLCLTAVPRSWRMEDYWVVEWFTPC